MWDSQAFWQSQVQNKSCKNQSKFNFRKKKFSPKPSFMNFWKNKDNFIKDFTKQPEFNSTKSNSTCVYWTF